VVLVEMGALEVPLDLTTRLQRPRFIIISLLFRKQLLLERRPYATSLLLHDRPAAETPSDPGYHIPAKPPIFFGRDMVVQETVSQVLQHQHVALIGPGGVGKSSISKAVMHDERIVGHFGFHRCFVTYDGVDTSMMTHDIFISRLCSALAIQGSATLTSILSTLRSAPTLLVIDNAETFLSAGTKDVGQIKETITDLGGHDTVHLILTTRSANLPNLPLSHQDIGGLDVEASRATFTAIYKHDIGNRLDSLFSSLDHHALSISLLSHIATQNAYRSTEEIEQAWKQQQQTRLLTTGEGKLESLPVTIELSINSPSLKATKSVVFAFLRTVAFLPEGIHHDDLSGIFFNFTNIQATVNAVCLSSLTSRSRDRYTMLAPIRMYITDQYNANMTYQDPVLVSIRNYAYQQVFDDPEVWGVRESTNTERLLSFDLTSTHIQQDFDARLRTLKSARQLLFALQWYHPRETSLFSLLQSVSEERPRLRVAGVSGGKRSSKRLVLAKAECLIDICWLQYKLDRDFIKNDMLRMAESFCRSHTPTCTEQLVSCLRLKGIRHQENGNLFLADEALREASTLAHSLNDPLYEALLNHNPPRILFLRGNISEATSLMASAEEYFRPNNQHIHLVTLLVDWISVLVYEKDFETAREILGQAEELDRKHDGGRRSCELLNQKASIEGWAGKIAAAVEVLDEATRDEICPGALEFDWYVEAWRAKASYAATVGSFDDARIFLGQATKLQSETGGANVTDDLLAAYIELYSGKLGRAKELLETMLEEDDQDNVQLTGFILRALGEVALFQEGKSEAEIHFGKVVSMCNASGMSPKLLYGSRYHYRALSAKYNGWSTYLDTTS